MGTFRSLTGKEAKLEFALEILHTLPGHNEEEVKALIKEARNGKVFSKEDMDVVAKEVLELVPTASLVYNDDQKEAMEKFKAFRDRILKLAEV